MLVNFLEVPKYIEIASSLAFGYESPDFNCLVIKLENSFGSLYNTSAISFKGDISPSSEPKDT